MHPNRYPLSAFMLCVGVLATSALGSEIHVERITRYGGATWASTLTGEISGASTTPTGVGLVNPTVAGLVAAEGTIRLESWSLDFAFLPMKFQSTASGLFAFNGENFFGRAGLDFRASTFELMLRNHLLERDRVSFDLMVGGRLMTSDVQVYGVGFDTVADDTLFFPAVGGSLRVEVRKGLNLFGVFKWFDSASGDTRKHTYDTTLGISYAFPPVLKLTSGVKASAGYRTLNLRSISRLEEIDRAAFDITLKGPYVSVGAVF